jgi:3-oxoacyl-[acyl-carrier protein] reductase
MNETCGYKSIYLILGGSSDVGIQLIKSLNGHQRQSLLLAHYFTSDVNLSRIETTNGNAIICLQADLSSNERVLRFILDIKTNYGVPTHIVHLPASCMKYERFKDFDWEGFKVDFELQVHSVIEICKSFLPVMAKRKAYNKIVFMLSSYTIGTPPGNLSHYGIIKYAMLGLLKALAVEYQGRKVNINGVSPAMMETKFLNNVDARLIEMAKAATSERRFLHVDEVVPGIEFLLSNESNAINGINLNISSGNVL